MTGIWAAIKRFFLGSNEPPVPSWKKKKELVCYSCGELLSGEEKEAPVLCDAPKPSGQRRKTCGNIVCDLCAAGVRIPLKEFGIATAYGDSYRYCLVCPKCFKEEWV